MPGLAAVVMPYFASVFLVPAAIICGIVAIFKGQKMRIFRSYLAIGRATEIVEYIAMDNPVTAEKWVDTVFKRELIYSNYRIIYRVEKKMLSALTVRHVKQLLPVEEIKA